MESQTKKQQKKHTFPSVHRIFRRIRSFHLCCVSSNEEEELTETLLTYTCSKAPSSPASSGSLDSGVNLQEEDHQEESVSVLTVESSVFEQSVDCYPDSSDFEECEPQDSATLKDAASDETLNRAIAQIKTWARIPQLKIKHFGLPNIGNTCYMNAVLQCLLGNSSFHDKLLYDLELYNDKTRTLRALIDLQKVRLMSENQTLRGNLLRKLKHHIESRHTQFSGDTQQDAHEFMVHFLSILKEEGKFLQSNWPEYSCPAASLDFRLKRLLTCTNCGFHRSLMENNNCVSLNITPQRSITDSLEMFFRRSTLDFSCRECGGSKTSETLEFMQFPSLLVLQVLRFNSKGLMHKINDRLKVPEEFLMTSGNESRDIQVIESKTGVEAAEEDTQEEVLDANSSRYSLAGVVSHLGQSIHCGHYISHIHDFRGHGWLECNDSWVTKTSFSNMSKNIGKNCYMLFYEKI